MSDIKNREDLDHLIRSFYTKAMVDPVIGFFFTEVMQINLVTHIPKIVDFWNSSLFQEGSYSGNPIMVHKGLHQKHPIEHKHFQRWVELFTATIDELFIGEIAERAKQRATSIATIMEMKVHS